MIEKGFVPVSASWRFGVKHFGEIFKKFRETRGLKLKDIAKSGISTSQLSRFENGETDLTITKFINILNEINVSWDEFILCQSNKGEESTRF